MDHVGRTFTCAEWWIAFTLIFLISGLFKQALATDEVSLAERNCRGDNGARGPAYDPQRQNCCNGVVENKRVDVRRICCGGQFHTATRYDDCCREIRVYDVRRSGCCSHNVYDRETEQCCSNRQIINKATHTCCEDGPVLGVGQCCGSDKVHNPGTHMCCSMASQYRLVAYSKKALEYGEESHYACCGLQSFNQLDKACCNDMIFPISPFHICCGSNYIDSRTHVCCNAEMSPLQDGRTSCCDTNPYNPNNQTCSNGQLFPLANGRPCARSDLGVYSPTMSSCCQYHLTFTSSAIPSVTHIQSCCGSHSYMKTDQICCNYQLHNRSPDVVQECCGTGLIDTATQICCTGVPFPKMGDTRCCGAGTYDAGLQTCCAGIVADIRNGDCCENTAYDPEQSTCCIGTRGFEVHNVHGAEDRCCGHELRNNNQICANSPLLPFAMIVKKSSLDHDGWCYGGNPPKFITFNTSEKVCSSNGFPTYKETVESTCGGRLYNKESQLCCNGVTHAKTLDGITQTCCPDGGTNSYDPLTQSCIANVVTNLADAPEKCSRSTYNRETHICKFNMCIREKEAAELYPEFCGNTALCNTRELWYNPSEKKCCVNQLYGAGETCCAGRVFSTPGTELGEGACRNGVAYNPTTQMYCGRYLHNITSNEGVACCGNRIYSFHDSTEICCGTNLWSTDEGKTTCTGSVAHRPGEILCGNRVMNVSDEICCQGMLYPREDWTQCCGNQAFDSREMTTLCCANTSLYTNAEGRKCCNDQIINSEITTCCIQGGVEIAYSADVAESYCCSEGSYDNTQDTCCDGVLHFGIANGNCSGVEVVRNPAKEMFCGGRLQPINANSICCNGNIYDKYLYSCCGDTALHRYNYIKKCCGETLYNTFESVCENDIISSLYPDPPVTTTKPTVFTTEPTKMPSYSAPTDDVASSNELSMPLSIKQVPLCGNSQYHANTSKCCNEQILHLTGHRSCCNNVIYNIQNQTCIKGKVRRIKIGRPCGIYGEGAITNHFVCCNHTFVRIRRNRTACCGSGSFNPLKEQCCDGVVINNKESKCCGGQVINQGEDCCNGKHYVIGKSICCHGEVFDRSEITSYDTTFCCDYGEVLNIKSGRCRPKDCRVCDKSQQYWRKNVCRKRFLRLSTVSSVSRRNGNIVLGVTRMTEVDRQTAQWQNEVKDIQVVIKRACKCQYVARKITKLQEKGEEKDYMIMTDAEINEGRLLLSYDDYVIESKPETVRNALERIVRKCDV